MKKLKNILVMFLAFGFSSFSQNVITSVGANAIGNGGSSSFSVGQVVYSTHESSSGSVSEGIQQALEVQNLSTTNQKEIFSLSIYPNPTSEYVTIDFDRTINNDFTYQLFDVKGRLVLKNQVTSSKTLIDLRNFPSAMYFLNLSNNNKSIQSFKILKN